MEANLPWRKTTSWQTLPSPCHPKSRNPPQQLETLETSEVLEEPSTWWINKAPSWVQHQETYSPYLLACSAYDGWGSHPHPGPGLWFPSPSLIWVSVESCCPTISSAQDTTQGQLGGLLPWLSQASAILPNPATSSHLLVGIKQSFNDSIIDTT